MKSKPYTEYTLPELATEVEKATGELRFDDIQQMMPILSDAIAVSPRNLNWADGIFCRARVYLRIIGNIQAGLEDAFAAHYYYKEIADENRMTTTNITIAYCYMRSGMLLQAIEKLHEAHLFAQKLQHPEQQARSLKLLADSHGIMQDYQSALEYSQNALKIARTHKLNEVLFISLFSVGQTYFHLKQPEKALTIAEEAVEFALANGTKMEHELAYSLKGMAYQSNGEHKKAIQFYDKCIDILNSLPNPTLRIGYTMLQKCTCQIESGAYNAALKTALYILNKTGVKNDTLAHIELHSSLVKIYKGLRDTKNAKKHSVIESELVLQHSGEELRSKVKMQMAAFNAERFQLEAQLERERAERLVNELENKDKELTMLALNLAQKNEMLSSIEQKLAVLEKSIGAVRKDVQLSMKSLIDDVQSDITSAVHSENAWVVFEQQFITIHPGFVERLCKKHPVLKPMEVRLCALLKVSLSTKQIANILCIDSRSVDVYRSRIRKKIGMERAGNLMSYLAAV